MTEPHILSVQTGRVAPLGPEQCPSGFVKSGRQGLVAVGPLGLEGDEQADRHVHGGPDKAVYAYAARHYPDWAAQFPTLPFAAGAMGENLTIAAMEEADLCVGDMHRIGSALLQVCQPRQPCFKLDLRHGGARLSTAMVRSFRSGWYYRVLEPGTLKAGDGVKLADRPHPEFSFSRLVEIVYRREAKPDELKRMTELSGLSRQWRERAKAWLG